MGGNRKFDILNIANGGIIDFDQGMERVAVGGDGEDPAVDPRR